MIEKKDCYKIFDIKPNCTQQELKKRYKELAKLYHPDNAQTGNLHKFQEIAKAYQFLSSASNTPSPSYYYPEDPIHYPKWSQTRYTKNTTFISIVAGCMVLVSAFHFFYIQSSHASFIRAADQHHLRSSLDLKRARTEAKLFGNERGITRVLNHRLREFRKEEK